MSKGNSPLTPSSYQQLNLSRPSSTRFYQITYLPVIFCLAFLLSFSSASLFAPVRPSSATGSEISVNVAPLLSLATSKPSLSLSTTPTSSGSFISDYLNLSITTNNPTGYTLSFSDSDTDTSLLHTTVTSSPRPSIVSLTTPDLSVANFTMNSWGYSTNGDTSSPTYHPIPSVTTTLASSTTPSSDTKRLDFATKVNTSLPSGIYTDTLVFSLTANPVRTTIFDITNLQQMTSSICNDTTTPLPSATNTTTSDSPNTSLVPEKELVDIRDNKTYIVRKLADGKCWMTQNLDLDLSTATQLNNQNTDLNSKSSWTPENSTQATLGIAWGSGSTWQDQNQQASSSARSYNPGDIYYTGTGNPQSSSSSGPKYAHAGNLYNWYAATAGSGTYDMTTLGQEASDSSCPKGWKLPYGNNQQSYSTTGDFRNLTNTYGITSGTNIGNSDSALLSSPLHFVHSGHLDHTGNQVSHQGTNGYVWSSSNRDQNNAHFLDFYSTGLYSSVSPQSGSWKGRGYSIRCLAR